jgi:hypothetical protein
LRWRGPGWHTRYVLIEQPSLILFAQEAHRRFFYGYRPAVPVV